MSNGNRAHRIALSSGLLLTVVLAAGITDAATLISKDGAEVEIDDVTRLAQHSYTIQRMTEDVSDVGNVPLQISGTHLRLIVDFVTHFPLEIYQVGLAARWLSMRFKKMGCGDGTVDDFVQALDYLQMRSLPVAMGWMLRRNSDWLDCSTNRIAFRERPDAYHLIAGPIRLYHLAKRHRIRIREAVDICNHVVSDSNASHICDKPWSCPGNVLHNAARDGEEFVVEMLLLLTGFNVNAQAHEDHGQTALHYAVHRRDSAIVRLLLRHPAVDVNPVGDGNWYAPLQQASSGGTLDVVKELLKHPAINVNIADSQEQWTPLILAAQHGRDEIVQELLKAPNIGVNQPSADSYFFHRWTPLHWAADHRHTNVVQLLVNDSRTEINPRDSHGRTPLTLALSQISWAVAGTLLGHGAIV